MIDVDRAQITRQSDGTVLVDDPAAPVTVAVQVDHSSGIARATQVTVTARGPARISTSLMSRLPLPQIVSLAAATGGTGHPDEPYYRQLARPKPRGARAHWDRGHWQRVLAVYEWAEKVDRPGGGARAVAQFWNVTVDPTVYRWLKIARGKAPAPGQ